MKKKSKILPNKDKAKDYVINNAILNKELD